MTNLRSRLSYEPQALKFGTSGRRGEVIHLTPLEIYINVLAELGYLQSLSAEQGGIIAGDDFYFGYDLRPSSTPLCQTAARAIGDAGMRPVNLGRIPTPALTYYALSRGKGSLMVTGSHIPFDRNGYKLNTSRGELLKQHEAPINAAVQRVRERIYDESFDTSLFDERGHFKSGPTALSPEIDDARTAYLERYTRFFDGASLNGKRILVYQHSAVGRDLLLELLRRLGADAFAAGRSETFVPIDTENIDADQLAAIQKLVDGSDAGAVVSTDGDSDRPLILGVRDGRAQFFPGDLVGMIVAEYLGADAVVVPVSCNDAIDASSLAQVLEPKTRIGSPYVIAGMDRAREKGRKVICGWEANGGFLLGSDIERGGRVLRQLATRDAFLPICCVLFAASGQNLSLTELFERLPKRYSRAALLKQFPRAVGLRVVEQTGLENYFTSEPGFGPLVSVDTTDGVRMRFANGDVAHIRPSGNADELRIYAVANSQERANEIAALGVAEPDGILRRIEKAVTS